MSTMAVEAAASRVVTARTAATSLRSGSARAATSMAIMPVMVSSKVAHGGATRISSGRRRDTKCTLAPSATEQIEGDHDEERGEDSSQGAVRDQLGHRTSQVSAE